MLVNYSEKVYENYYCCELKNMGNASFYSPSQELENYLGCDCIVSFRNQHKTIDRTKLKGINEELSKRLDRIPSKMFFSAFIQFKRPEYMIQKMAREWAYYASPYYRVILEKDQFATLVKIKEKIEDLDIFYAFPHIKDNDMLYNCHQRNVIIENSIVIELSDIYHHKTICCNEIGNCLLGFSEPEALYKWNLVTQGNTSLEDTRKFIKKSVRIL